ncbi:MAG: Rieske (2Fe-2S) protein [Chitinophagaceae bacterium]
MSSKIKWKRIAASADEIIFQENNIAVVQCEGKNICIGKNNNQLHGFAYKCPHASGIMANGFIDAIGNVVCPLHRYKFNMSNGRNVSGEGYHLRTYPIEQRDDGVYLGMETSSFFS